MISSLKISQKLMLIHVVSTFTVLLLAGTTLVLLYKQQNQTNFESRITKQGVLVASNSTAAVLFEDWEAVSEILSALATDSSIRSAVLTDMTGSVVSTMGKSEDSTHYYETRLPVLDGSNTIAWLSIKADNQEVTDAVSRSIVVVSILTCVALFVGLAISVRVQRIVTIPIFSLSRAARQVINDRDYSIRVNTIHHDEIGSLTEDFNAMLQIIARRDQQLESKVSARTRELHTKNAELQNEILERARLDREKREIQERFENAFHNAPIGMALVKSDGVMMQSNKKLRELMKISWNEDFGIMQFVNPSFHDALLENFCLLSEGKTNSCDFEADCQDAKGDQLQCILNLSAVHREDGSFKYAIMQVNDVTESKRLSSELAFQASHDVLTGLANRRVLEDSLRKVNDMCEVLATPYNLMLLDLDQFKIVNDSCGHEAGDVLLVQISALLRDSVRPDDTVARLGGDEFAILLHDCDQKSAAKVAEKIRCRVEQLTFSWEESTFRVGVSVGVVHVNTREPDTSILMRKADSACYAAKEAGRNQVFIAQSNQQYEEKQGELQFMQRITEAMEKNYLTLFTQCVVPLQQEEDNARKEVLLRFRSRGTDNLIPPGAFLPVAERYGLSTDIDRWVVRRLIELLQNQNQQSTNDVYWLNLNGSSLGDAKFLSFLEQSIEESEVAAGVINFEITETAVIRNLTDATKAMKRLKNYGCQFALDDFGTGLSSFGYLKSLPVDYVKIDGMFVRDIANDNVSRIFVKSIIDIAQVMDIKTVAEFVENQEIRDIVTELGADYGQGFGLGRPKELFPVDPSADSSAAFGT